VTLLTILLLVTLVLFALFLGGGIVAQGYLYQEPADRLPVRALAAAVLVGSFLTIWVWIDKVHPGRYDTFFQFAAYDRKEFSEFEAVRWVSQDASSQKLKTDDNGSPVEVLVKYKRGPGKTDKFYEEGSNAEFKMNGGTKLGEAYMTAAIIVKPDPNSDPIRLNAQMTTDKRSGSKTYATDIEFVRFVEDKGSRYVEVKQLGVLYVPSSGTVVLALLINLLHFVVWFVAFWPILQFTRGHAFALTTLFGLVTMLLVMPLLFKPNRNKPPQPEPQKVAWVWYDGADKYNRIAEPLCLALQAGRFIERNETSHAFPDQEAARTYSVQPHHLCLAVRPAGGGTGLGG
jgi:hypothetical protein